MADGKDGADRDRETVLARRKFFVASALAGVVAAGCERPGPFVCLEPAAPPPTPDGGPSEAGGSVEPPPQVCLEYAPPLREDAAAPAPSESTGSVAPPPDAAPPEPCLRVAPEPPPRVCLKVPAKK
ncbi:MAG: hypothetical protein U0263_16405 [Polyangiaceae bacterium]